MSILPEKITCYICEKEARPATPLFNKMCSACYDLYYAAEAPRTFTLGHPANQTYIREKNQSAIQVWEEHLKKHGFVKKWRRWRKKK